MNQDVKAPRPTISVPQNPVGNAAKAPDPLPPAKQPSKSFWYKNRKIWYIVAAALVLLAIITTLVVLLINKSEEPTRPLSQVARQYQEQLPELKKQVDEKPDNASARKNYAVALYATGDLDGARTQYEEAVKLNDKDAIAYNNLANTYRDLNQTDKAIEAYRKAIQLDPKSINTYANLANVQLYAKQDADAAIATYKQGLEALPNNVQLQILLGIAYETAGKTGEAKATYENILKSDPDNATAKTNLEKLQ